MARRRTLAAAVTAAKEAPCPTGPVSTLPEKRPRGLNPMAAREGALADVAAGKVRDVRLRLVDPKTCRMWSRHDRLYDRLTPVSCADLIDSIKAQGRQEVPALVRRLKDDPGGYEYEVIAGARRHYAVSYLRETEHRDVHFLVEVRDMADEEAFRFSDIENRSRQDISDWERGRKYLAALGDYYEGNQTRMAERMEVSKALLSSYLALAKLPDIVVRAYGDPREIAVRHGQQLSPMLNGPAADGLIARAGLVAEAQHAAKHKGQPAIPGSDVFKMLRGERPRPDAPACREFKGPDGRVVLTAKPRKGRVLLDVDLSAGEEAVLAAVREALRAA